MTDPKIVESLAGVPTPSSGTPANIVLPWDTFSAVRRALREAAAVLECNCGTPCLGTCSHAIAEAALARTDDVELLPAASPDDTDSVALMALTIPTSEALRAEAPWCGWLMGFAADSEPDTVASFGITHYLQGINVLLTTSDGRSRPVRILNHYANVPTTDPYMTHGGIEVTELDTEDYERLKPEVRETVRYIDIRELVVF